MGFLFIKINPMAQRRMFSKAITSSARFLKMPIDTQVLYFHLCLNADDDWVVEAYYVMKMVWCWEDNLRVLVSKEFVKVLNEDFVSYIMDWKEHNLIRADRKIDSLHKQLLLKMIPQVELVLPKPRADTGKLYGQPMDVQRTTNGQPRLGKDRVVKDNISTSVEVEKSKPSDELASFIEKRNAVNIPNKPWLPNVRVVNEAIKKARATKRKEYGVDDIISSVNNYCKEISRRKDDQSWYINHRFTLLEFLTRKTWGIDKFINLS